MIKISLHIHENTNSNSKPYGFCLEFELISEIGIGTSPSNGNNIGTDSKIEFMANIIQKLNFSMKRKLFTNVGKKSSSKTEC